MSEIDWREAPEWANVVGRAGLEKRLIWSDHKKYSYVNGDCDGKSFNIGATCAWRTDEITVIESRPELQWSGEGRPPVGIRCEAAIPHTSGPDGERSFIWIEGNVIAYYEIKGKTYAWFAEDDGFYPPNVLDFRPIRTPEQIAADERSRALHVAICDVEEKVARWNTTIDCTAAIKATIDAMISLGYRKP